MAVFKYMTHEGVIRFLSTWHLRITPPSEFNDPFELQAPVADLFSEKLFNDYFDEALPTVATQELANALRPVLEPVIGSDLLETFTASILFPPSAPALDQLVEKVKRRAPRFTKSEFLRLQGAVQRQMPLLISQAKSSIPHVVPLANTAIRDGLTKRLPQLLGVLCLSRCGNQPLMWSHYSDCHRGAVVEFDDRHATFNRRRSEVDDLGFLRPVVYSESRPPIDRKTLDGESLFEVFALTKAAPWSYEEEVRLIWPLKSADQIVDSLDQPLSLNCCPPDSVMSVTLGCKADPRLVDSVQNLLKKNERAEHIRVRRARMDSSSFSLVYEDIGS